MVGSSRKSGINSELVLTPPLGSWRVVVLSKPGFMDVWGCCKDGRVVGELLWILLEGAVILGFPPGDSLTLFMTRVELLRKGSTENSCMAYCFTSLR